MESPFQGLQREAERSESACFGTSHYGPVSLSLALPTVQRLRVFGKHDGAAKCLKTRSKKVKMFILFFEKGGAELSFPPDWPNLTVIDVHPWQPSSQSAKSNRKSSEGA